VSSWVSYAYHLDGQLDSALVESGRAFQNDSMNITTLVLGSLVRLKAGRKAEARDFVNRGPRLSPYTFYVLAATGDTAGVRQRLDQIARGPSNFAFRHTVRALAMLGAGDTTKAVEALERATEANELWPSVLSFRDPIFDPIRGTPRFRLVLQRLGLSASAP
jgi:hypothetical protein